MIADKILHRIRGQTTLTLDDPTGYFSIILVKEDKA